MKNRQRLELTWIGKEERPRLEPRILLHDPEKSYHSQYHVPDPRLEHLDEEERRRVKYENILIHGDNLLALKALEQEFEGKVKCIYIDPPFNTGEAFEHYDDGLEHSVWLQLMFDRIKLLHTLLNPYGSLFVHLNDDEADYCKVLLDEVFGRNNFVSRITVDARSPSAFSTVNPGVFKASEYLLWFAKDRNRLKENSVRVPREPDPAYNMWVCNPGDPVEQWTFSSLVQAFVESDTQVPGNPLLVLQRFNQFVIDNAHRVCRLASISDSGAGAATVELKYASLANPGVVHCLQRDRGLDDVLILDGQQLLIYEKNVAEVDGRRVASRLLTNIWTDIAWEGIASEGGVTFRKGKKPERLIKRCLEIASIPGDLVLDSFAGSGTTGAVAHKMGRRWIMIELREHCHTHIIPRMKKVIDGEDQGGITKAVGWNAGGGFRYYRLAPTLIHKDKYGNDVINPEYNAEMLAEAMCKHMGFRYAPSDEVYWIHGQSTERDYIYVTTQPLTPAHLQYLNEEVGPERSLLIMCTAFRGNPDNYENLTIKKIPKAVLGRCEFGRDDYSLEIRELPVREEPAEDDTDNGKPRGKERKKQTPSLFTQETGE